MTAYYNENDPYAAQWLRNLIEAGHIAPGHVDERSIVDVRPADLDGFSQCHFFAGIGGWSLALRLAGWPDAREVWTGSCPCQPFSAAGKGRAFDDERHLWPAWFALIRERAPATIFGEQVEKAIGWGWLDLVFADLEKQGYACRASVLPACGIGAPHRRKRIWFVADADGRDAGTEGLQRSGEHGQQPQNGRARIMGNPDDAGSQGRVINWDGADQCAARSASLAGVVVLANGDGLSAGSEATEANGHGRPTLATGWHDLDWLACTDGKARPVEPGTFPLAHGIPNRVGRLRAYGNAIVPALAAAFIESCF